MYLLVGIRKKSDLGSGDDKKHSENDQSTGHFQRVFDISKTNSKTSKVNQQSVSNISIFHIFPKNLHRTTTFDTERNSKIYFFK